jgi:hypothetical protein
MPTIVHNELPHNASKQEQELIANQIAEAQQKLITVSYDKAATYTTVIIFGGYAGFFATWQLTKDYLTKPQALWSGLLILISLLSFVLFEVIKMILVTRNVYKKSKLLQTPKIRTNPKLFLEALRDVEAAQQGGLGIFILFWGIIVAISVGCALVGTGILSYAFITGLIK